MNKNGTVGETLCTDHTGYFYTIGGPNGLGKIHQPGTRGRIIDDGKPFRPAFTFYSNSSSDIVVRYPTLGYGAAWAEGTSTKRWAASRCSGPSGFWRTTRPLK